MFSFPPHFLDAVPGSLCRPECHLGSLGTPGPLASVTLVPGLQVYTTMPDIFYLPCSVVSAFPDSVIFLVDIKTTL